MNINRVTITGADDKVDPRFLLRLTDEYPFVEWGILFSKPKEGQQRYPSDHWVQHLLEYGLPLSAHFCGWYAREVLEKANTGIITKLSKQFNRIQLNYNFKRSSKHNLIPILRYAEKHPDRSIILQYNKSNAETLNKFMVNGLPENIHFLYDSSGGRGTEIQSISDPIGKQYTGYSGGIHSKNISRICAWIYKHNSKCDAWIDLESGARTNNEFDLKKVQHILQDVKGYMDALNTISGLCPDCQHHPCNCPESIDTRADLIGQEINKHLDTLPYAGGYPSDWRETLSKHLAQWMEIYLENK